MSRFATAFVAAVAAITLAAPASAATFDFGGSTKAFNTGEAYTLSSGGYTVSALGYSFAGSPASFQTLMNGQDAATILGSLTAKKIHRDANGIGVCWSGEAANECNQVDANGPNEMLRLVMSEGVSMFTATFDMVDPDDTLKLYGVTSDGKLEHLGYGGIFDGPGTSMGLSGLTGEWLSGSGNNNKYVVTLNTGRYTEFWFGNNNDVNDGYRLDSIAIGAVPEPGTWALMIGGFGMAGATLRRRRLAIA